MIVQNKDEVLIKVLLETVPAPEEFRDAVESLSPEQRAFCKAYREMQVCTSMCVCVLACVCLPCVCGFACKRLSLSGCVCEGVNE